MVDKYEDPFVRIASMIGGDEYLKVARSLLKAEDATDEEIASSTGLRINMVRKVLYDLFGKSLITGIRVKDERKGWFVYRWRTRREEVGNVIATKGTGSPRIMLCGHMDVVPGKVKVRKEGDSLYGRGASDAKAPLMAMLFAAASIEKNQGTVIFVGAVDEEGNAIGIKNIVKKEMNIDYAVFGEPSGIKQVTIVPK